MIEGDNFNPRLAAALEYLHLRFALLPIAFGTKLPHSIFLPKNYTDDEASWKLLSLRPASEPEVRHWFDSNPDLSLGVICGEASLNLVVVDFDDYIPTDLDLPATPTVKTSRGKHLYYRSNTPIKSYTITGKNGVRMGEVRSSGNYVVIPPSVHPDGTIYTWASGLHPREIPFAEPPSWVYDHQSPGNSPARKPKRARTDIPTKKENPKKHPSNPRYTLLGRETGPLIGDRSLTEWARNPEFVCLAAQRMGIPRNAAIPAGIGRTFCCVLPGHEERSPSASLFFGENGVVLYHDFHRGDEWFLLPEVRASQAYEKPVRLTPSELAVWQLRMLVETGFVRPVDVQMPDLPVTASVRTLCMHEGFRLLLGCKWLHSPGEPTPYSWRFARAWCGISEWNARKGIKELILCGALRIVGRHSAGRLSMDLYLPGQT